MGKNKNTYLKYFDYFIKENMEFTFGKYLIKSAQYDYSLNSIEISWKKSIFGIDFYTLYEIGNKKIYDCTEIEIEAICKELIQKVIEHREKISLLNTSLNFYAIDLESAIKELQFDKHKGRRKL